MHFIRAFFYVTQCEILLNFTIRRCHLLTVWKKTETNTIFLLGNVPFQLKLHSVEFVYHSQFVRIYANYSWHVFQCLWKMMNEKTYSSCLLCKNITNYGNYLCVELLFIRSTSYFCWGFRRGDLSIIMS